MTEKNHTYQIPNAEGTIFSDNDELKFNAGNPEHASYTETQARKVALTVAHSSEEIRRSPEVRSVDAGPMELGNNLAAAREWEIAA
jgi:hypothetical protein